MRTGRNTPKTIQENQNAWFFTRNWRRMHCDDQQFNAMYLGQCGSGKTLASIYSAQVMDRTENDQPRFNIERIAFSAADFTRISAKNWPFGTAIILDDAAFSAYSKDSLTREVKQVSKIFISQRHKRRCVLLSLPSADMLAKNVQQTLLNSITMTRISKKEQKSYATAAWTSLNPWSGKLYFRKFTFTKQAFHPIHHVPMTLEYLRPRLVFDKPTKEVIKNYEKIRNATTAEHYEEAQRITAKKKEKKRTLQDDYNFVKGNIEQFLNRKGLVDIGKIMLAGVSEYRSRQLSKILNEERKDSGAI